MSQHSRRYRSLACAIALAIAAGSSFAQAPIDNSFDGGWVGEEGSRRGLMLDYLEYDNVLFYTYFSYDNDGQPVWLTSDIRDINPETFTYPHQVGIVTGGSFDGAGNPQIALAGDAVFEVLSCNEVKWSFLPAAGVDLPPAEQTFTRFNPAPESCKEIINECPTGTTAQGTDCALPNSITGNLHLPAGKKYLINGAVFVEDGAELHIAPGVTLEGGGTPVPDFLAVKAGGKIFAEGTRSLPITFTGPEPVPGSWAGVVLNGYSNCNESTEVLGCAFEAVPELRFGGNDPHDSSGVLRFVRILWAGEVIRDDEELNSLTMNGVGDGTVIEYVQVHGGLDDGFEWFGGTVNGRYLVASQVGDDAFDCDDGFQGKMQFALNWQGSENGDQGTDSNGIECDNDKDAPNVLPRTTPTFSNVTLVGSPFGNEGARIRRGSGGHHHNMLITGFADHCLNIADDATAALTGNALTVNHSFLGNCGAGALEGDRATNLWNAGTGNRTGDPMLDRYMPKAGSPVLTGGQVPNDPFFRQVDYIGAFDGSYDWTRGWVYPIGE